MDSPPDIPCNSWSAAWKLHTFRVVVGVSLIFAVLVAIRYYGANKLDREIRFRFEERLREHYQGLRVSVRAARRLDTRGIEVRGIRIQEAGGPHAAIIAEIEEAILHCDTRLPELLTQIPKIERIDVRRVKIRAERKVSGVWNVSHLLPFPSVGGQAPAAIISDGTVEIIDPSQENTTPLTLRNIELNIGSDPNTPAAAANDRAQLSLKVQGSIAGDHFERVELVGTIQPFAGSWDLRGAVEGLEFSPRMRAALPREAGELLKPLSSVRGRTQFSFQVACPSTAQRKEQQAKLTFVVHGRIAEGRIDDERLPDPLTDVEATIRLDPRGIWIDDLTGRCGPADLKLSAELQGYSITSPCQIDLTAENLNLDRLTVSELPLPLQKVWADYAPRGVVDVQSRFLSDGRVWTPTIAVKCRNLSVQYEKFPYRLTDATGTLHLQDDHLQVRLEMIGGGRIIGCRAEIDHPGPEFRGWVQVHSQGGPLIIDDRLLNALTPAAQSIVHKFHPRGAISFRATLQREHGSAPLHRQLSLVLHDLSIQHDVFPYPIDKVNGRLEMTDDDWDFHQLTGRNDSGQIAGHGTWRKNPADGNHLKLQFTAKDLPFEDELRQALTPAVQRLWVNLRPRGNIDQLAIDLKYDVANRKTSLAVVAEKGPPNRTEEGRTISLEPSWFRYSLDNVTGRIEYRDGETRLSNVTATHGRVKLQTEGQSQLLSDGSCRVQLSRVTADRVQFDHELLAALPAGLAASLSKLAINGPLNLNGALGMTIPAGTDLPPQVDWDLKLDLQNGSLNAGVPIEHIFGAVQFRGQNSTQGFENRGELNIDSAIIKNVQLTQIRGPLLFDAEQIRFGTWAEREPRQRTPRPLTANVFGGVLAVDGQMRFGPQFPFQLQAWLEQGDLATIARELAPRQQRLGGKVFAIVQLSGTGEGVHTYRGEGQIRLRDASLYELPAIFAMLQLARVQNPDRTAFDTSSIDFRIEGDDVELDRIEFAGDAITLKGKGRLTATREIDVKLYSQVGRDEVQIPLFRPILGEASRQFLLFEVTGPIDRPVVNRQVFPQLNERLQELFPELAQLSGKREPDRPTVTGAIRQAARDTRDALIPWR